MSELPDFVQIIFFLWVLYYGTGILWTLISGIRTYMLTNIKFFHVNLIKKYGQWAVVTGSSDGIGKEYAKELARRGMNVVLISRTFEKLKTLSLEIESKYGVQTKIVVADFSKGESVYEHIRAELTETKVGILVNNVGVYNKPLTYFTEQTPDDILYNVNLNVIAALLMTRMILPQMQARRKGAIVNVSSVLELHGTPLGCLYSAAKAFVKNFTDGLRFECRKYGITFQLLSPCFVRTNMVSYSERVRDSPFTVSAEKFAQSAVNALGVVDYLAGHWLHGLQHFITGSIPNYLLVLITGYVFEGFRRTKLKKENYGNEKEKNKFIHFGTKT